MIKWLDYSFVVYDEFCKWLFKVCILFVFCSLDVGIFGENIIWSICINLKLYLGIIVKVCCYISWCGGGFVVVDFIILYVIDRVRVVFFCKVFVFVIFGVFFVNCWISWFFYFVNSIIKFVFLCVYIVGVIRIFFFWFLWRSLFFIWSVFMWCCIFSLGFRWFCFFGFYFIYISFFSCYV